MLIVEFQGREWLFTGESLDGEGAITTPEAYGYGQASYAHVCRDGTIKRYRQVIGRREDLRVIRETPEPEFDSFAFLSGWLNDPAWRGPQTPQE